MTTLFRKLMNDEAGLILSAELVIILTIAVIGMVVGLVNVQHALLGEFADISLAFQSLNQSYSTPSYRGCWKYWGRTSWVAGSSFIDLFDGCVGSGTGGYGNAEICGTNYYSSDAGNVVVGPQQSGCATGVPSGSVPVLKDVPSVSQPIAPNQGIQPVPQGPVSSDPCPTCH